ncbi:TRAP transporter small permease subunit [Sphingosinicella terrae]|uniref:TRAP transporter small permease subunit n=1 Tax=Sphingosinicella terrae TaxID=2172047 RepID=UPI000E0CF893|nr:TRAP transporter small permease subunit [Sphingosinicella terrae]
MKDEGSPVRLPMRLLVAIGGGALLLAMAADAVAVVGRHVGLPLLGSIELVQAAVLLSAAAAIVVATVRGSHAVVHLLVERWSPRGRFWLEVAIGLSSAFFFAALLAGTVWIAADLWNGHEESELLRIPYRPLRIAVAASAAAVAITFLVRIVRRGKP